VEPVHVGLLLDYPSGGGGGDLFDALRFTLDEATESGLLDRPVELVTREVLGLPNGSFRAVHRAFLELVEEDCLVIFGPYVSENAVPLREHVEALAQVPLIAMSGSESLLGEWFFALNNGSMEEEPPIIAAVMMHDGRRRVGAAFERSLIGQDYLNSLRAACHARGIEIVAEVAIPQVEAEKTEAMLALRAAEPDAIVHVGFGHGLWGMNAALAKAGWDPPRYTTTAFELVHATKMWTEHIAGFVGLDSYDERNEVGQRFLDRFEQRFGRRPEYFMPCYAHDLGQVIAHGLAGATPLTGRGVKESIERIKMIPAASGAPGTKLRFGKFIRQGWMGSEYLVARYLRADGTHVFHGTSEGTRGPAELAEAR
jgi:hypothetical protein